MSHNSHAQLKMIIQVVVVSVVKETSKKDGKRESNFSTTQSQASDEK